MDLVNNPPPLLQKGGGFVTKVANSYILNWSILFLQATIEGGGDS